LSRRHSIIPLGNVVEQITGKKPLMKYCGATLPITHSFQHLLGVFQVLLPLANEDCAMHGVNENLDKQRLAVALA